APHAGSGEITNSPIRRLLRQTPSDEQPKPQVRRRQLAVKLLFRLHAVSSSSTRPRVASTSENFILSIRFSIIHLRSEPGRARRAVSCAVFCRQRGRYAVQANEILRTDLMDANRYRSDLARISVLCMNY